jgi:hypothetical protein
MRRISITMASVLYNLNALEEGDKDEELQSIIHKCVDIFEKDRIHITETNNIDCAHLIILVPSVKLFYILYKFSRDTKESDTPPYFKESCPPFNREIRDMLLKVLRLIGEKTDTRIPYLKFKDVMDKCFEDFDKSPDLMSMIPKIGRQYFDVLNIVAKGDTNSLTAIPDFETTPKILIDMDELDIISAEAPSISRVYEDGEIQDILFNRGKRMTKTLKECNENVLTWKNLRKNRQLITCPEGCSRKYSPSIYRPCYPEEIYPSVLVDDVSREWKEHVQEIEKYVDVGEQIFYSGGFFTGSVPIDNLKKPCHHGIYVGNGYVCEVIGRSRQIKVQKLPFYDFAQRAVNSWSALYAQPYKTLEEVRTKMFGIEADPIKIQDQTAKRYRNAQKIALETIGQAWIFGAKSNCQHYATYCSMGVSVCIQFQQFARFFHKIIHLFNRIVRWNRNAQKTNKTELEDRLLSGEHRDDRSFKKEVQIRTTRKK